MFSPEQIQSALSVVESQRAAATEAAIQLAVRVADLERQLKAANDELERIRPLPQGQ